MVVLRLYDFVLVLLLCVTAINTKKFPTYIEKCRRTDVNMQKCLYKAIQKTKPHLLKGIPEFHLPPMDPLILPEVGLNIGNDFQAKFQNIQLYNVENFVLKAFNMDLEKNKINFNMEFPVIRIKTDYVLNGKLLFMVLNGQGPADGNITDVKVIATMNGHRTTKRGKQYFEFDQLKIDVIDFGKPQLAFRNLFANNPELTERTNEIVNQNAEVILEELRPTLEDTVAKTVLEFVGRVFSRFSVDELFPY